MRTFIENFKREHIIYRLITVTIAAIVALFLFRVVKNTIVGLDYPNEILEPANIHFTNTLINGNIPYERENIVKPGQEPPINYEYPFLNNMFAAAFSYLTGGNTVAAHYLVSFLAMIGTAVLGAIIINRYSRTTVGTVAGFLLLMFCHWRYGYISASPDGFGLLVTMMTLYCAVRPNTKHRAFRCALLTVACFYSKQYFAGVCVAIFIYMWCYSKKEAVKYFGWCVITLVSSIALVTAVWPLYWDYSLLCLMHGTFQGWSVVGFIKVLDQMKYLAFIFAGMIIVLLIAFIKFIKDNPQSSGQESKNRYIQEGRALPLFLIQIPIQTVILFFIGRNDGAYLTYFLQLLIPSLIIATLIVMEQMKVNNRQFLYIAGYCTLVVFTVFFGWTKLPMHMLTDEDIDNWEKAYALMDEYRDDGDIYHFHSTVFNGIKNGDSIFFTGHDGDVSEKAYLEWQGNTLKKFLFPDAGLIFEENLSYRKKVTEDLYDKKISIVSTPDAKLFLFSVDDLEAAGYSVLECIPLQVGNVSYDTYFWTIQE